MSTKKLKVGNVPNLRFREFEGEWEIKKLGEVCKINPQNSNLPNTFVYIDLESVVGGILLKEERISKEEAPSRAQRLLEKNDVLFQMVRPYQKNNLYFDAEGDYVASTGYAQIRTEQNPQFIFQYLHFQKFVDKVIERCTGTSYPAINSTDLSNIPISFPILSEQKKIADFLSIIDLRISTQSKIILQLETSMQSIRDKLLKQQISLKDEKGDDFPDWEVKKLGDCLDYIQPTNYLVSSTEYHNSYKTPVLTAGKTFILGYTNEDYGIFTENLPVIIFDDFTIATKFVKFPFKAKSSAMKILVAKEGIDIKFIYESMQIIKYEIGGHERHWISKFAQLEISIPSLPEQNAISIFLSSIDEKIDIERKLLEQYEKQKKYLLQSLFI